MNSEGLLVGNKEETAYEWFHRCQSNGNERGHENVTQQQWNHNNMPHHALFSRMLMPKKRMTIVEGPTTSFLVCSLVVQIVLRRPESTVTILDPEYRIQVELFQDMLLAFDPTILLQDILRRIFIYRPEVDNLTSQACYLESYSHYILRKKKPAAGGKKDDWLIYHNYPPTQHEIMRKLLELESHFHSQIICTIDDHNNNNSSTNTMTRNKNNVITLQAAKPGTQEYKNGYDYVALIPMDYGIDDDERRDAINGRHIVVPYKKSSRGIEC